MLDLLNPYFWAVSLRNYLYDRGLIRACDFKVPVVSVGNLSVGGSGKSSLVIYLARELSKDFRVCILSRGYGRKTRGTFLLSRWGELAGSWQEGGDEPYMMARLLKGVSVVVDENRCRGADFAIRELEPEVILLDDGFQHRRIHRDLNILLLRKRDLEDRLLPFGRLREPLGEIKRADVIVLSYTELEEWNLQRVEKPVFKLRRKGWKILNSLSGEELKGLEGLEFVAFAGLGDNRQFFESLKRLGVRLKRAISLLDHYDYRNFHLSEGELYITTLKDMVKLKPSENLYWLDFEVEVEGLIEMVKGVIIDRLKGR